MMEIKSILPIHDLPQYSIEKQLDAVEKKKKGPELSGESMVYMIKVCLCFGVAEQGIKKWRAYPCCSMDTIDLSPAPRVLYKVAEEMVIKNNEVTFYTVYTMRNGK